MPISRRLSFILLLSCLLAACGPFGGSNSGGAAQAPVAQLTHTATAVQTPAGTIVDTCPGSLGQLKNCYTPHALRVAYGLEASIEQGFTGKGQTVVDIVSFGSPTLQQDMDVFDRQFALPPITVKVVAPLGTVPFNPKNNDMVGWALETELDVQIIHAIAPDAGIVVMTSPVDETEGTIGLPQFLKLEQYAVSHHLGQVFSQSYVASETTLSDSAGRQLVKTYADFYQQITTQQGWTVVSGSGDHGATDFADVAATKLSPTPIVNFPADVPWVTAVGGTTLARAASGYNETAWSGSGGGFSKFFSEPDFQKGLPQPVQAQLGGRRGLPDVAADANPETGMAFYFDGNWSLTGGYQCQYTTLGGHDRRCRSGDRASTRLHQPWPLQDRRFCKCAAGFSRHHQRQQYILPGCNPCPWISSRGWLGRCYRLGRAERAKTTSRPCRCTKISIRISNKGFCWRS